jgi:hypothetical protein
LKQYRRGVFQEIFATQNLPESLRFLSIITFKNTVERQWTRNIGAQMQQKDAEKAFLRQKLLQLFNIPNIRVCVLELFEAKKKQCF